MSERTTNAVNWSLILIIALLMLKSAWTETQQYQHLSGQLKDVKEALTASKDQRTTLETLVKELQVASQEKSTQLAKIRADISTQNIDTVKLASWIQWRRDAMRLNPRLNLPEMPGAFIPDAVRPQGATGSSGPPEE